MLSAPSDGGQGRNRTADASLFRAALYQLSYLATLFCLAFARTAYALARDAILAPFTWKARNIAHVSVLSEQRNYISASRLAQSKHFNRQPSCALAHNVSGATRDEFPDRP